MKILITGGAGYIGSVCTHRLLNRGHSVTIIDNLSYNQNSVLSLSQFPKFKFIYGDVLDLGTLKHCIKDHDIIIPLAAIVGAPACDKYPELATKLNYTQIKEIIKICSSDQIVIMPNTNSQYGSSDKIITEKSPFKPLSHYAKTKCDAEDLILTHPNGVAFRLATVFGVSPRMRLDLLVNDFVFKALHDGYITLFESHFVRNYIHLNDVSDAFAFAIENITTMRQNSFNVGLSSANCTKLQLCETIKKQIPDLVINTDEFRTDKDKRNYIVSNEKLENLGWTPNVTLDGGISQLIQYYEVFNSQLNASFTNL